MVFINTAKPTGLFVVVTTCILSAQTRLEARVSLIGELSKQAISILNNFQAALAEVSVVFYDDVNLLGASFSPAEILPGVCQTLPGNWLDRAESLEIGPGYTCNFYVYVSQLIQTSHYNTLSLSDHFERRV